MIFVVGYNKFEIRPLSLLDFIGDGGGVPYSFFKLKKSKTKYDELRDFLSKEDDSKIPDEVAEKTTAIFYSILDKAIISLNGKKFNTLEYLDQFMDNEKRLTVKLNELTLVFDKIHKISFKKFDKIIDIDRNQSILIAKMCKDFGKTPIEVVYGDMDYTELDAYVFNTFVFSIHAEFEYEQHKKQVSEMKNGR